MPKEVIYSPDGPMVYTPEGPVSPEDATPGQGALVAQRAIHAGWAKAGHVEVGSAEFEPATDSIIHGFAVRLERKEINRLIQALRRARDQAFGADA